MFYWFEGQGKPNLGFGSSALAALSVITCVIQNEVKDLALRFLAALGMTGIARNFRISW